MISTTPTTQHQPGRFGKPFVRLAFLWCLGGALLGIGCGTALRGTVKRSANASLKMTIHWPQATRLIPNATRSLRLEVFAGEPDFTTKVGEVLGVRPEGATTSQLVVQKLPQFANLLVVARALPTEEGTGTTLAEGRVGLLTPEGDDKNTVVEVTLNSAVARIEAAPQPVDAPVGKTVVVTATAFNAANAVLVTATSDWSWEGEGLGIATVTGNGASASITGVAEGTTRVTLRHKESGKAVVVPVIVTKSGSGSLFCGTCGPNGEYYILCRTGECLTPG